VRPLDILDPSAQRQAQQFGYNCDFVGFFPLHRGPFRRASHGILAVNNEFPNPELMFPGYVLGNPTQQQVDVELAALGVSIVAVVHPPRLGWRYVVASEFNRRITGETEVEITGPASSHDWLKVSYDPTGTKVRGTFDNCSGGKTPWRPTTAGQPSIPATACPLALLCSAGSSFIRASTLHRNPTNRSTRW
jgi:secreted PhoX family phosphatase